MVEERTTKVPEPSPELKRRTRRALVAYGFARLGLFLALAVVIQLIALAVGAPVPPVLSALLALFVALPLSMLVFSGMRERATASLAQLNAERKARKEWVRSELAAR